MAGIGLIILGIERVISGLQAKGAKTSSRLINIAVGAGLIIYIGSGFFFPAFATKWLIVFLGFGLLANGVIRIVRGIKKKGEEEEGKESRDFSSFLMGTVIMSLSILILSYPKLGLFELDEDKLLHALRQTLRKIKELLQLHRPTVIWSGNGYHIYIPIDAPILENIVEFSDTEQVSTKFIRFAEWYLSNGKSDSAHNTTVSLNNYLLRVPGSINSKINAQVKIVKEFDKRQYRTLICSLVVSMYILRIRNLRSLDIEVEE